MKKEVYIDLTNKELNKSLLNKVHRCGVTGFLGETDIGGLKRLSNYEIVSIEKGKKIFDKFSQLRGKVEWVIVETTDMPVIQLENAITFAHNLSLKIATHVKNFDEAKLSLNALQIGVDAVIVEDENIIDEVCRFAKGRPQRIKLIDAKIIEVIPKGMGSRVCVDMINRMKNLEGMLVGSQSKGLFLIESESYETPYIDPRYFRVNAGAENEYIQVPGERTKYLSELKSGDQVCLVDIRGNMRVGDVGRCKEEERPMVLLKAEWQGKTYTTFVQNAETIRLVGKTGSTPLTELLRAFESEKHKEFYVKLRVSDTTRHFGVDVKRMDVIER